MTYLQKRGPETGCFVMPTNTQRSNEIGIFGPDFTVGTVIPEPGSFMLVGLAGLTLGLLRRIRS